MEAELNFDTGNYVIAETDMILPVSSGLEELEGWSEADLTRAVRRYLEQWYSEKVRVEVQEVRMASRGIEVRYRLVRA